MLGIHYHINSIIFNQIYKIKVQIIFHNSTGFTLCIITNILVGLSLIFQLIFNRPNQLNKLIKYTNNNNITDNNINMQLSYQRL